MTKYLGIAEVLSIRIRSGDYRLSALPTEEELAGEFEVSRMTARRALQELIRHGTLQRGPNQRLQMRPVRKAVHTKRPAIAVLTPAYASPLYDFWRTAVERVGKALDCDVRPVVFLHWHDPTLLRVLRSFDGVFLALPSEPTPLGLLERFARHQPPTIVFSRSLDEHGIPTIDLFPSDSGALVLDHLYALGHRRILCFNVHSSSWGMAPRIATWRQWIADHAVTGDLLDVPVEAYGDPWAWSYHVLSERLASAPLEETAIYCTTAPCAAGAMRALRDHGREVGRTVSVCATNDEGWARFFSPSLTCLLASTMDAEVRQGLEWMLRGGRRWKGPTHRVPSSIELFAGESTGPATP